jgi:hypothetical protein
VHQRTLLIVLFCAVASVGRADYFFTWNGLSGDFHAGFEVTDSEMQSNSVFDSPLFMSSLSITSIDGTIYHDSNTGYTSGQFGPPFILNCQLWTPNNDYWINIDAGPQNGMNGVLFEWSASSQLLNTEHGYWSYAYVSEPNSAALMTFAAGILLIHRTRLLPPFASALRHAGCRKRQKATVPP